MSKPIIHVNKWSFSSTLTKETLALPIIVKVGWYLNLANIKILSYLMLGRIKYPSLVIEIYLKYLYLVQIFEGLRKPWLGFMPIYILHSLENTIWLFCPATSVCYITYNFILNFANIKRSNNPVLHSRKSRSLDYPLLF